VPDVRLARSPALAFVFLYGKRPRGADKIEIVGRAIGLDCLEEVLESSIQVGSVRGGS